MYKKGRETKITHFCSPIRRANCEEGKKREEEEEEGEAKKKGMESNIKYGILNFV